MSVDFTFYPQEPAHTVVMVRPLNFGFHADAALTNHFAHSQLRLSGKDLSLEAQKEFDLAVETLRKNGIEVWTYEDDPGLSPDAVFPNNWFTTHPGGRLITYPLRHEVRRLERTEHFLNWIKKKWTVNERLRLETREASGVYLEGTGSLVFDHTSRTVFACVSERTNRDLVLEVAGLLGYEPAVFEAVDETGFPVYHTNVIVSAGFTIVLWSPDTIPSDVSKNLMESKLKKNGRKLIEVSLEQMKNFACNALELTDQEGKTRLVISRTAFDSLTVNQKSGIKARSAPIVVDIPLIESVGGGSIRCMLAEIFF